MSYSRDIKLEQAEATQIFVTCVLIEILKIIKKLKFIELFSAYSMIIS